MLRQQHGLRTAKTVTCPTLDQGFRGAWDKLFVGVSMRLSLAEKQAIIDLLSTVPDCNQGKNRQIVAFDDSELVDIFLTNLKHARSYIEINFNKHEERTCRLTANTIKLSNKHSHLLHARS